MSLIEQLQTVSQKITRELHGEAVTLVSADGSISTEITDAVVSLPAPAVTRDAGPVERDGVLRLAATHHDTAKAAHTATVRGDTWDILTVGDVYAGTFRVEVSRLDGTHPNQFDLAQEQPQWT